MSNPGKKTLTLQIILDSLDNLTFDELQTLQKVTSELIQHHIDAFGKPLLSELIAGLEWPEDYQDHPPISEERLQEIQNGARPTDTELEFIAEALEMDIEELLHMLRFRQS